MRRKKWGGEKLVLCWCCIANVPSLIRDSATQQAIKCLPFGELHIEDIGSKRESKRSLVKF